MSAEVGNSSRHPDSYSGHLPTLLCSELEYMFPESTLKIFPGTCSSLPVTVIQKKVDKSNLGKKGLKGLKGLFYLTRLDQPITDGNQGRNSRWDLKWRPQTNTAHHLATPDLLTLHSSGPLASEWPCLEGAGRFVYVNQ